MSGISRTRLALYGLAVVVLLALNAWRMSTAPETALSEAVRRDTAPIGVPNLQASLGRTDLPAIGERDLFRAAAAPEPKPVVTAAPAPAAPPKAPDPIEIAREQATKQLDQVRLIGVLASGDKALAVFEHDGNTLSRFVGDEIVSGFKLDRISQGEIRARHERLGLVAILSLGGVRPMQMTRVE